MRYVMTVPCIVLSLATLACAQTTKPVASVERPRIVSAKEWGSKPQPLPDSAKHTPKFITIHHAGVLWKGTQEPANTVRGLQAYGQKEKNWPDLPYHFLIAPDGTIFEGRSLAYEPQSNTNYPLQGHVGVELMGNFEEQRVSQQQMESLVALSAYLCSTLKLDPAQIAGHRDRAEKQTVCPGKDLYRYIEDGQIRDWVTGTMAGEKPQIVLREALPNGPTDVIPTTITPATKPATTTTAK
jgi:hypothetical protein